MFGNLILETSQMKEAGYIGVDKTAFELVGKKGVTTTMLMPSGKVEIDDDIFDAMAETGFIEKGVDIEVTKFSGAQLIVRKI